MIISSQASPDIVRRVVVVGGGLAGMASAVALQSAGLAVTLIEARKTLGGRAGSFQDPGSEAELDNCQHVLLGCCTNLRDFYKRLGVADLIRFEKSIHFLDGSGKPHRLFGVAGLPAPFHLGPAFLGFAGANRLVTRNVGDGAPGPQRSAATG
jgi:uncharacterized protein with NAD-binding domain and iron-sulfur cluster